MVRTLNVFAIAAALAALAAPAGANPILLGTTANSTGVDGVLVDGTLYDVTFSNASYLSTYIAPPTFLGNQAGAQDATVALAAALNTLGVTGLDGLDCPSNATPSGGRVPGGCLITAPYSDVSDYVDMEDTSWYNNPAINAWVGNYYTTGYTDSGPFGLSPGNADYASTVYEYAVFTSEGNPTDAPEPASLALLALGGALLGLSRRSVTRRR